MIKEMMMQCMKLLRRKDFYLISFYIAALQGCSTYPTILTNYESSLGVEDEVSREFHSSLYYPKGLALQYPGYVVGIQKADQTKVLGPSVVFPSFLTPDPEPAYFKNGEKEVKWGLGSIDLLKKLKTDSKAMFIQHITRFKSVEEEITQPKKLSTRPYTYIDSCQIYNAFRSPYFIESQIEKNSENNARNWRDLNGVISWNECEDAVKWSVNKTKIKPNEFYANGEVAIQELSKAVARDIKKNEYTHILILVMGWNTAQDEAIRNFNDITGNLLEAARETSIKTSLSDKTDRAIPFRPLVIGVSWPSFWTKSLANIFSYANKAKDADEIGLTWLNLLVNLELPKALKASDLDTPVVLIGHSFGSRVVTRVAAASPALKEKYDNSIEGLYSGAKAVIGLQGAVSINRFWSKSNGKPPGDEGAPLRDFSKLFSTRFAFTASSHDKAAGGPFWFEPTGSIKSYQTACDSKSDIWTKSVFNCYKAQDISGLNISLTGRERFEGFNICEKDDPLKCVKAGGKLQPQKEKVLYIDASDGITEFNTIGTGGNAHSDIYRLPMGRLLYVLINTLVEK